MKKLTRKVCIQNRDNSADFANFYVQENIVWKNSFIADDGISFDVEYLVKIEFKNKASSANIYYYYLCEKIKKLQLFWLHFFVTTYRKSNIQHSVISIYISILSQQLAEPSAGNVYCARAKRAQATRRAHVLRRMHTSISAGAESVLRK